MKKRIQRILGMLLAVVMTLSVLTGTAAAAERNYTNEQYMFNFLTQEMGLNSAVACGIMASAYVECGFNPTLGGTYYGLFQWGGSRKSELISWCGSNGYDYKTLDGQLHYFQYEISEKNPSYFHYDSLISNPDTQQGAEDAAYTFLRYYEGCASDSYHEYSDGQTHTRMWAAANLFWPDYGGSYVEPEPEPTVLTISMTSYPSGSIPQKAYDVTGSITPASAISWVQGYVTTADGAEMVLNSGHKSSLSDVDNALKFASLQPGYYYLTILAESTNNELTTWESPVFAVYNGSENCRLFSDVAGNAWYNRYVYSAVTDGFMSGDSEGTFRPSAQMTRAEAAVVICRLAGLSVSSSVRSSGFPDVPSSVWYAPYVTAAHNAGMVTGNEDGTYCPNAPVTREELAAMLLRALNVNSSAYAGESCPFRDVPSNSWAVNYITAAADRSLIAGYTDGTFGFNRKVTRAEAAAMLLAAADQ